MTDKIGHLRLQQAITLCETHEHALQEALGDLGKQQLSESDLMQLTKENRRLLDQFAYRYTRLQDDMGRVLLPAILQVQGEEISEMSVFDRLNRLEQLRWIASADEWNDLRNIRNEFTHEYPETATQRYARFQLALSAAQRVVGILQSMKPRLDKLINAV